MTLLSFMSSTSDTRAWYVQEWESMGIRSMFRSIMARTISSRSVSNGIYELKKGLSWRNLRGRWRASTLYASRALREEVDAIWSRSLASKRRATISAALPRGHLIIGVMSAKIISLGPSLTSSRDILIVVTTLNSPLAIRPTSSSISTSVALGSLRTT